MKPENVIYEVGKDEFKLHFFPSIVIFIGVVFLVWGILWVCLDYYRFHNKAHKGYGDYLGKVKELDEIVKNFENTQTIFLVLKLKENTFITMVKVQKSWEIVLPKDFEKKKLDLKHEVKEVLVGGDQTLSVVKLRSGFLLSDIKEIFSFLYPDLHYLEGEVYMGGEGSDFHELSSTGSLREGSVTL